MALNISGLRPLDTSGLNPVSETDDAIDTTASLDVGGLKPLDTTALKEVGGTDAGQQSREDTWGEIGKRLLENAPTMFKQAGGGLAQMLAEMEPTPPASAGILPGDPMWEEWVSRPHRERIAAQRQAGTLPGQKLYEEATKELEQNAPNVDPESLKGYAYDISQAVIQMVPSVAASIATRRPVVGATIIGGQVSGHRYGESRSEGRTPEQSVSDAAFYAASEGIPEMLPLGVLMRPGKKFLDRVLKTAGAEAIQEMFTEAIQSGYDVGVLDEEMTWGEALNNIRRAGIVGAGAGAVLGAGAHPFRRREEGDPEQGELPEGAVPAETLFGEEVQPEGVREQATAATPPPSQEDIDSPIPTDIIQEGKTALQDAQGAFSASQILEQAGFPPVESEVTLTTRDGGTIRGTVVDAFDQDGQQGAKIRLENGRVVAETFEQLRGRLSPAVRQEEPTDAVPVPDGSSSGTVGVVEDGQDTRAGGAGIEVTDQQRRPDTGAPLSEPGTGVPGADVAADTQPPLTSEAVEPQQETAVRQPVSRRDVPDAADTSITPSGREVPVRYAVVEATDLTASQLDDLRTNPDYPAELQPRDRGRAVSQQQIQDIATRLNPRLLDRSPRASDGAPIISGDGVVESGNGRILAIRRAYAEGLETSEQYRNYLAEQGYPVEGMNQPVLVRVREGGMEASDRQAFTREANERDTLGMSATERAMADATALPDRLLELYRGGDVDTAANRQFARSFIDSVVGRNEQAGMIAADGAMSQEAIRRIEAALLAKAYGDADLVASLIESADTNIKAIGGALMDVAPAWAQMRSDATAGQIDQNMDQTGRLLEAVRLVQRARREGRNIAEFVSQTDMLSGDALHPVAEGFLRLMFRNTQNWTQPAGRDKMAEALRFYLEQADRAQPGVDLLGETAPAPERILETARDRQYGRDQEQADLLAQPAGRPGRSDGEGRPERERPEQGPAPARGPETARSGEEGTGTQEVSLVRSTPEAQDLYGWRQPRNGTGYVYAIARGNEEIGFLDVSILDDGSARIEDIVSGRNQLGAATIRSMLRQLRQEHPQITTITGERVSGIRRGGEHGFAGSGVEISISLPSQSTSAGESPLRIEDYTDKSIIVRGQTRENIDRIKAAGKSAGVRALWNKKAQGWVFPKSKESQVREAMADLVGAQGSPATDADRRDEAQRDVYDRRTEDMSPAELRDYIDELRTEALTDERTGLGSNKAWLRRQPKAYAASIDLDSLKWVNDNMGHDAGDRMIAAVGDAMREAGIAEDAYHVSGDEFYVQADSQQQIRDAMSRARDYLSGITLEGNSLNYTGPGFSYGIGTTIEQAETALHGDKTTRETQGERAARGERPRGVADAAQAQEPEPAPGDRQEAPADRQGERAERPEPDVADETSSENELAPAQQPIEDFGEKIEGARKDTFTGFRDALQEAVDIAAEPLSRSFPQPNYEKLAEAGVSKRVLAHIALMRDMIPNKPRKGYKLKQWAEQVGVVRDLAQRLLSGDTNLADIERLQRSMRALRDLPQTAQALEDVAPADLPKAAQYRIASGSYSMLNGQTYSPAKTFWYVEGPKKRLVRNPFSNDTAMPFTHQETPEAAVDLAKRIIARDLAGLAAQPQRPKHTPVNVYSDRRTKELFLGFKVRSSVIRLKSGFEDEKAARAYLDENRDEVQATIDAMRKGPNMRGTENRPRSGENLREGDITPEIFADTFGFRGVQFGNYVEGPRRQTDLNRAYDALMDLADVLDIPPQALSLNGSLGLAFGARGKGGRDPAAAHYEPGQIVINLTKGSGPGSLAHEWLHAADNYFARQDEANGYMSERQREAGPVREAVYQAWKKVEESLAQGSFAERSAEADKARSKPYWNTTIEKAARAFERYIVDRLSEKGAINDYLANIDADGGAYPTAEEMESLGIRAAYDTLFETIETRETDRGVEMFALRQPVTETAEFKRWFGDSKVVDDTGEPLVVYHGSNADISEFDADSTVDGGFHFGTAQQAGMRVSGAGKNLMPVYLAINNPRRSKDMGGKWKSKIASAKSAGHDGIVYLNRYEGVSLETIQRAENEGVNLDRLTDEQFRRYVPEARDSYIVFRPEQIKSATGNRGTFDPADPRITYALRNDSVFFSALKRAAENLTQERGTAGQFLAMLKKQPGVKAEELEWTGLEEYLRARQAENLKVTKQEIVDFLDANGVQVDTVELSRIYEFINTAGDTKQFSSREAAEEALQEEVDWARNESTSDINDNRDDPEVPSISVVDHDGNEVFVATKNEEGEWTTEYGQSFFDADGAYSAAEEAREKNIDYWVDQISSVDASDDSGAKFSDYQLPGGENYREVLLTLPVKRKPIAGKKEKLPNGKWKVTTPGGTQNLFNTESEAKAEMERLGQIFRRESFVDTSDQFQSTHFDEPNILAHIRLNDRTDADGNKVLFVEEIQSDWHQKGRKGGYRTKRDDLDAFKKHLLQKYSVDSVADAWPLTTDEESTEYRRLEKLDTAVPDAPFKGNAWTELAIKRVLRMAAEEGYSSVAWTTGEQQAERYDLSKQIDRVEYTPKPSATGDTLYELDVYDKKGSPVMREHAYSIDQIESAIGKELAKKIANDEYTSKRDRKRLISGLDLKVGGEGMTGFYDRTLPNIVKKVVGKLDKSAALGEVTFRGDDGFKAWSLTITDKMRETIDRGLPLFNLRDDFAADAEKVTTDLAARLKQLGISDKVALNLRDRIQAVVDGQASEADGRYLNRVIEVALTAQDGTHALNHEVIHALRDMGLIRDAEWRALDKAARADTGRMDMARERYGRLGLTEDQLVEEAVAEMYADWAAGQTQAGGFLRRAFERIRDFLRALGRVLRRGGYHTTDSVFRSIERGDVGRRQPRDEQGRFTSERFAVSDPKKVTDPTAKGGAQARQKAANQWYGTQPLDQAMRLPFHLFGGINEHGEWNWGLRLSKKTANLIQNATFSDEGRFTWVNPYLEKARAGLLDRYGLDPVYVERERQRGLDKIRRERGAIEIMDRLKDASVGVDEAKVLQGILAEREIGNAEMMKLAEPIRNAIDDMGAEAVQLGLISAEAFERNRGAYLHRVYLKHENDQGGLVRWVARVSQARRRKIIGSQFKGRGLWIEVDQGRLMQRIPGYREAERGAPVQAEKFRVLDLVEHEGQETLRSVDPTSQRRVLNRIYLPADAEVPTNLMGYVDRGLWEVRGTKPGKTVLWRDFTKPERESMGEIVDARYTIAKTYMQMAHDLSTGRFFQDIALNEDWSTGTEPRGSWKNAEEYNRFWADPDVEWVKVPDTAIPKSNTKRYGALAGRYVRAEIWRDLAELERMQKAGVWNTLLTQWKLNKALALDTLIPTPDGWTTMGEIREGDTIFDEKGQPCTVLEVKDIQHGRPCYEVVFSDGTKIVADDEHWWFTNHRNRGGDVRTTKEIRETLTINHRGEAAHSIPVAGALDLPDVDLPIPPYALGAWLGDGDTAGPRMSVGGDDIEEMLRHLSESGVYCTEPTKDKRNNVYNFTIQRFPGQCIRGHDDKYRNPTNCGKCERLMKAARAGEIEPPPIINAPFGQRMDELKVRGDKHIPAVYLRASVCQRRELLMGLMDSDGCVTRDGDCVFVTSTPKLRDGFLELARSLGYKPSTKEVMARLNGEDTALSWRIYFKAYADAPVAKLARKASRLKPLPVSNQRSSNRQIVAITPVPSVPVRCIAVSSESHLYLAGDGMVPTHNTARSPVVHMNNIMSNVVLMDLADVRMVDLVRGIRALIREDADYKEAVDNGAFGSDMVAQEIRKNTLQPLLEEIQREMQGGRDTMEAKFGMLGKLADAIWSRAKNIDRKMTSLYQLEDEVFRMATYMRKRALGFEPSDAALQARDQFLNYDIRAPWVNAARRSVLPFISYTYRAIPTVSESIMLRPWKAAKLVTLGYAANALAYMLAGGDEDEERRSLRDTETGYTWIGAPRMIRMPWSDDYGNPVFLDIRRWIPAGDVFDMNQGHGAFSIPAPLQFGGPMMLGAELALNKQAFTGKEITNDRTDDWWDKTSKVGDWAWKSWMPSAAWIPGSWYWEKIGNAATGARDRQGRPYSVPTAVASSVGIKLKPQDVQESFFWKGVEFDQVERELRSELGRLYRDHERGLLSKSALERRKAKVLDKLENLAKERKRTFTPQR